MHLSRSTSTTIGPGWLVIAAGMWLLLCHGASTEAATILDFDALAPGTLVTTLDGVDFSSNIGLDLVVSSLFDTTSSSNYLGVDDGGFEVFFPGDVVTLTFAAPVTSASVSFVSSPFTPGSVFSLIAAAGSASSGGAPASILGDGGEVFPVTFSALAPFSVLELTAADGLFSYNIDDIIFVAAPVQGVPEPSILLLLGLGAAVSLTKARSPSRRASQRRMDS